MTDAWKQAFAMVFEPYNILEKLGASLFGLIVGAEPGLTATRATALLEPDTYNIAPNPANPAIETATASPVGELYNEVPDRVSDVATLVGLGYALGGAPVLGFLAAICALFVAYVRAAAKVAGAPQDYSGPMAKQHRMFTATLAAVYCAFAPDAWQPTWNDGAWGIPAIALAFISVGSVITALRRLLRAGRTLKHRSL